MLLQEIQLFSYFAREHFDIGYTMEKGIEYAHEAIMSTIVFLRTAKSPSTSRVTANPYIFYKDSNLSIFRQKSIALGKHVRAIYTPKPHLYIENLEFAGV